MQPRWLIAEFEERNHEHDYQIELLREYYELQRQLKVLSDEYLVRAQISYSNEVRDLTQRNTEHGERHRYAGYLDCSAQDMHHATKANMDSSEKLSERTTALVHTWTKQVHLASMWVSRATAELNAAEADLRSAQRDLYNEEARLSQAEAALAYKQTQYTVHSYQDSNGKWHSKRIPADTSSERAAVARAQANVSRYRSIVAAAQQRVSVATADLRAARNQLQDAESALEDAETADSLAQNAQDFACQACKSSTHALNQYQDIDHLMQIMGLTLGNLGGEVDYQGVTLSQMQDLNSTVRQLLQHIDHDLAEIIQQTFILKSVLTEKADLLYAFDSPE